MFRKILLFIFFTAAGFSSIAQIVDEVEKPRIGSTILNDTIQPAYGPTTTEFFFYRDVINNTAKRYNIDTSVLNTHKFSFNQQYDQKYQDLGNIGTAIRPVYYQFKETVGRKTGFDVYDPYYNGASEIRFFDTKSPYSRLGIVIGGQGRSLTEASFARNFDERSNFGFNYRGTFIDKQIERAQRGDRVAQGVYYNIHANYHTKNNKYHALAAFIRNSQNVDEYGGVRDTSPFTDLELYYEDTVKVRLANTSVFDLRREYFYYHEFHLTPIIEIFHEFKHYDQLVQLTSMANGDPDGNFQPDRIITTQELAIYGGENGAEIKDFNKFDEYSNKFGLAGTVGNGFYKVYYQRRNLHYDYRFMQQVLIDTAELIPAQENENLAGAMVQIGTSEDMQLGGQVEYADGGFYNIQGNIALKYFYGKIRQMKRKPSYIENAYRSNLNEWYLKPSGPVVSELDAGVMVNNPKFTLNAGAKFQRLTNHIYFQQDTLYNTNAMQNSGTVTAMMPHLKFTKWFGDHWLASGEVIYSIVGGDNAKVYPLPDLFTNFLFSYTRTSFGGNFEWQLGLDTHWKSAYYAPGYDPFIQQFFIQDEFKVPAVPIVDLFLNARINRARIFVKLTNIFQQVRGYGYMPTPYYPGQLGTIDFGFNWSFYD